MKNAFIILLCCLAGLALADESKLRIGISGTDKKQIGQLTKSLENCFTIVNLKAPNVAADAGKKLSDLCDLHITAKDQCFIVVDTRNNLKLVNMRHWPDNPETTVEIIKVAAGHYRDSEPAMVVTMENQTTDYMIREQGKQLSQKADCLFETLRKDPRILFLRHFYHRSAFEKNDKDSGYFQIIEKSLPLRGRFAATSEEGTVDLVIYIDNRQNLNLGSFTIHRINQLSRSEMEEAAKHLIGALLKLKADQEKRANSEAARLFAEYKELRRNRNTFQEAVSKLTGAVALEPDNVVYRYEELECYRMVIAYTARYSGFLQASNDRLQKVIAFKHDFPDFNQPVFKNRGNLDKAALSNIYSEPKKEELADYAAFCDIWRPLYMEELRRLEFRRFDPDAELRTFEDLRQYSLFFQRVSYYGKYYDMDKWLAERYAVSQKILEFMNKLKHEQALPKKFEENFLLLPMNGTVLSYLAADREKLQAYMSSLEGYFKQAAESPLPFYQKYAAEMKYVRRLIQAPCTIDAFEPIIREYFNEYQGNFQNAAIWNYGNTLLKENRSSIEPLKKRFVSKETLPKTTTAVLDFTNYNSNAIDHIFREREISPEKKDYFYKANSDFDIAYHNYKEIFNFPSNMAMLNTVKHQNNLYLTLLDARAAFVTRPAYTIYLGIMKSGTEPEKLIETPFKTNEHDRNWGDGYPNVIMAAAGDYFAMVDQDNLGVYDLKNQIWSVFDDFIGDKVCSIGASGDRIYLLSGSNQTCSMISIKADGSDRRIHFNSFRGEKTNELDGIRGIPEKLQFINDKEMVLIFNSSGTLVVYLYNTESNRTQLLWEKKKIREYCGLKLHGENLDIRIKNNIHGTIQLYRINLVNKSVEEILARNFLHQYLFNGQFRWESWNSTVVNMKNPDDRKKLYLPLRRLKIFDLDGDIAVAPGQKYIFTIKRKQQ